MGSSSSSAGGFAEERLREQHAHLLAALQLAHLALVQRSSGMSEPVEQNRGVGFRRVAALFADDSFELAEAHAVLVGQSIVRLGVELSRSSSAFHSGRCP